MSPSLLSLVILSVAFALADTGDGAAAAGAVMSKRTVTLLEIESIPTSGTTAGAVPTTAKTVRVDGPEPKPALPICHVSWISIRPRCADTPVIWNRPARLVRGPWNGVPGMLGVVDSITTSPGAPSLGPGWKVAAAGLLKNGL